MKPISISPDAAFKGWHFTGGLAVIGYCYAFWGWLGVLVAGPIIWVVIGIKEKWIDPQIETPETAGDGWVDWAFWFYGTWGGVAIILIHSLLRRHL